MAAEMRPEFNEVWVYLSASPLLGLTAVLVITTGILGAILARSILNLLRIGDPSIRGFALGVTAHGIGTARAFQVSAEMGAFAGLAMGVSGVLTALLLPLVLKLKLPGVF
jgi:putative effector of murein hydrolase